MKRLAFDIQLFAVSSSISNSQVSRSIEKNDSVQRITFSVTRTSGQTWWQDPRPLIFTLKYYNDEKKEVSLTQTVQFSFPSGSVGMSKSAYVDFTVPHKSDGTQTIDYSASISTGTSAGTVSPSKTGVKLETIPRASTVTANDSNIGSVSNIIISRASDKFTHTIKYNFGNLSGTIATKTSSTAIGFTVPTTFYSQIPNAKSGICTITCETYNDNTLIGTKTTAFIATASESLCKPTLSASAIDVNETTIALTGDSNKLISGYSNAQVTYNSSAKNSATLTSVTVNGISVSSPVIINGITTGTITVVATDSRGYSTEVNINKTLINYIPLSVNPNFYRTSPTTGQVSLSFSGNYFNNTFGQVANTLQLTWSYRVKGQGDFIHGGNLVEGTHYKINGNTFYSGNGSSQSPFIIGANFDYKTNYEFVLYYTDKLVSTGVQKTVPRGEYILGWNADKVRTNGVLEVNSENNSNIKLLVDNVEKGRLRAAYNNSVVLSAANNGYIYLRPNGVSDTNGELVIAPSGNIYSNGANIKKYWGLNNFDNALTEGYYIISGTDVVGAPYTGNIYGKLNVDINNCTYWNGTNNFIWQTFIDSYGNEFRRQRINASSWTEWKLISRLYANQVKLRTTPVYSTGLGQVVGVKLSESVSTFDLVCVRVSFNNGNEGEWLTIPVGGNGHYYFNITMLSDWYFRGYVRVVGNEWIDFCVREVSGYDVNQVTLAEVYGIRLV